MIKQNRRVPGTIHSTPIYNRTKSIRRYQNETAPNDVFSYPQHLQNQQTGSTCWNKKENVLKEREENQDRNEMVEVDLSEKGINNLQGHLEPRIKCSHITVLNLSHNQLSSIPAVIFNKLSSIAKLYLNNNSIDKISFPYFKENKLRILDISCNNLKGLNLEHVDSMIKLNCSNNQLSFLTLPPTVAFVNCSDNKLSNIYFLEKCYQLEELNIASNVLYDLKFSFRPYITNKGNIQTKTNLERQYALLTRLDCSNNKIQFIEGMQFIPNLKILLINNNQISLTRHTLNQIFLLQQLQNLSFEGNPLEGFSQTEMINMVGIRLPFLTILNGQPIDHIKQQAKEEAEFHTERKSTFSGINEEPYQLFMDSYRKIDKVQCYQNAEWNFTLGDCDEDPKDSSKIHELSQIQVLNHCQGVVGCESPLQQMCGQEQEERIDKADLQQTYHLGLLNRREKEIKLKVIKSTSPLTHQHVYYQEFFNALLPMSYIPATLIPIGGELTSARRMDCQDDEHVLIQRMFQNRGGVVYVKKVNRWNICERGKDIFSKNHKDLNDCEMGFLLKDISEVEFREMTKFNRLVRRGEQDIIGKQPNAFTYFHILVRNNPQDNKQEYYQCVYFIETSQL